MSFGKKRDALPQSSQAMPVPSGRGPKQRGKHVKLEQASECEIYRYYKRCIWASYNGTGWYCSMPVCWREFKA